MKLSKLYSLKWGSTERDYVEQYCWVSNLKKAYYAIEFGTLNLTLNRYSNRNSLRIYYEIR